ncbi:MAG: zinc-dependent alcohol dehydrogenase family protein, partial [Anaerolineales bacterium]|nr:zinc-dependent alcohol dehydrogenase family protein [Anaerolineales bacterium]
LRLTELPIPQPSEDQVLIEVEACGVCHTEIDEIEGRTSPTEFPMVPGHQVVGKVVERGAQVKKFQVGDRVGVAWIYAACGECSYCSRGEENLCPKFRATGRDAFGGYAEYMVVGESFAYSIPEEFSAFEAAPLLCAGAIGYRSLRLTQLEDGMRLGLTGFGASAHLVLMMSKALYPNSEIYVFSRSAIERDFAMQLGAIWAGAMEETSPQPLDAIIDTTPAWKPVLEALRNLSPGGRLVINAIRKEDFDRQLLVDLDYPSHLWMEKEIKSVANVTRQDVKACLQLIAREGIRPEVQIYSFDQANQAILDMKNRKIKGAKVLRVKGR